MRHSSLFFALLLSVTMTGGLEAQQPVQVVRAVRTSLKDQISLPGKLIAEARLELKARITGYLVEVPVDYGTEVERGALLARIDVPDLEARYEGGKAALEAAAAGVGDAQALFDLAQARIEDAKGSIAVAKTEVGLAEIHVGRMRKLAEKGGVSAEVLDEAEGRLAMANARTLQADAGLAVTEAAARAAQAAITSAEATRRSRAAELAEYSQQVTFARLTCPFERGVVTHRRLDPGALVRMDQDVILELQRIDKVRAEFRVPESDAPRVTVGMPVDLRFSESSAPVQGVVARTARALTRSKVMIVQVDLDNTDGKLLPGTFIYATLLFAVDDEALTLPARALRVGPDGATYVMVAARGKAVKIPVTVGSDNGIRVSIDSGLTGEEDVILIGDVDEGAAVRVVETPR